MWLQSLLDLTFQGRIILCCIRGRSEHALETLELCHKFKDDGVVGMDLAGNEAAYVQEDKSKDNFKTISERKTL